MRSFIVAASLAAIAMPGMAFAAQTPPPGPDRAVTRADAMARADQRFDALDTDRDGKISATERAVAAGPAGEDGPRRRGGGRMLERADANRDGVVTRGEFRAMAAAGFDRQDVNRDGKVDAAERRQGREQRMSRRGQQGGTITRAAFQARALARFERMDVNKDGQIDPAERFMVREKRMQRRAPHVAG
ncbi:hypothetical protein ASE73_13125 [Sphingomonas sp. Leaf24]|uniref:hypothetical protein n=1 Tax=unclassified Sphingomonas TaxID=196159 RepID=UPI0007018A47|nr:MULTISPECIES: hypothetical protein [unclassified Sphingomonas]KQM12923.1 hypothetical protein ASE50_11305 [Sphingomonas sp. Leaf5]KQM94561.1 hypothetical protein ASE73_13125 [Sphingomonas sp. Leaf24]